MSTTAHTVTTEEVASIKEFAKLGLKIGNRSYLGARYMDGVHSIDIGIEIRQPEGTEPPSVSRRVTLAAAGNNEIHRSINSGGANLWASQDHGYHGPRQSVLGSLANTVRVGDHLHVSFVLGNDTDRMKDAGLTKDEAYVTVVRKGKMLATFCVATQVSNGTRYAGMSCG